MGAFESMLDNVEQLGNLYDKKELSPLNKDLCDELERVFKPLGVVAFTRWNDVITSTYAGDGDFEAREDGGVHYIQLVLAGKHYNPKPKSCLAMYEDFGYLMNNWDKELELLTQFCHIVTGNKQNNTNLGFRIERPRDETEAVRIIFDKPLNLDPVPESAQ